MDKFYKKQIKLWKCSYENNSEFSQETLHAMNQYVYNGTKKFTFRGHISPNLIGDIDLDNYSLYESCIGYYQGKAILEFEENNDYLKLLEGYYHHILINILGEKRGEFESGFFDYDFSLLLIFTITYFPKYISIIGRQFVRFLEFHAKQNSEHNHYSKKKYYKMFGYPNVIWLTLFICKWYGLEELSKEIQSCFEVIPNPAYQLATENLLSMNEEIVNQWVEGLSDFHIKNSKDDLTLPFNNYYWRYYPIEIIALLEIRHKENMSNEIVKNDFVKRFLPHIGKYSSIEFDKFDEFTKALTDRIIEDND